MNRRQMLLGLASSLFALRGAASSGQEIRNYTTLKVRNYGCTTTFRSNSTEVVRVSPTAITTVPSHDTRTVVRTLHSNGGIQLRSIPVQSNCPGGVCPSPTIRVKERWYQKNRLGQNVHTTTEHLTAVHGFSPEIVASAPDLDLLHGSPDAPKNPHTYG